MTWLTSLPAAVLVISGLALALLVAIGGRLTRVVFRAGGLSDRQSRSRRGNRPRRHAAWTLRSTCRGPADRGGARPVSGRWRARGRRAAGRGQPRSRTR